MAAVAERAEAVGFVTVAPPGRLAGCEAWVGSGRAARGRSEWRPTRGRAGRPEAQVRRPRGSGEEEAAAEPAARVGAGRAGGDPALPESAGWPGRPSGGLAGARRGV